MAGAERTKLALVVHPDVGVLSSYQALLTKRGFTAIVARDLPTALLAMTQHLFDLAIVSARLFEAGDGWPLAGVIRLVFPRSFVAMLTPDTSVLTLQSAINNGVTEVYADATSPQDVVGAISNSFGNGKKSKSLQ